MFWTTVTWHGLCNLALVMDIQRRLVTNTPWVSQWLIWVTDVTATNQIAFSTRRFLRVHLLETWDDYFVLKASVANLVIIRNDTESKWLVATYGRAFKIISEWVIVGDRDKRSVEKRLTNQRISCGWLTGKHLGCERNFAMDGVAFCCHIGKWQRAGSSIVNQVCLYCCYCCLIFETFVIYIYMRLGINCR